LYGVKRNGEKGQENLGNGTEGGDCGRALDEMDAQRVRAPRAR
jgi:hypothetical protein